MKTLFRQDCPAGAASTASRHKLGSKFFLGLSLAALSLGCAAQAQVRSVPIPTPTSQPISITIGPDGNFWFTEQNSSRVARITPAGVITEFQTPTFSFPFDITPGPDGLSKPGRVARAD